MKFIFLFLFTLLAIPLFAQDFKTIKVPQTRLSKDSLSHDSTLFYDKNIELEEEYSFENAEFADNQEDNWSVFSASANDTSSIDEYIPSPLLPIYGDFGNRINPLKAEGVSLNIRKTLVREDTTAYDVIGEENIVIISEELAIDCVWVTLKEYYAVWDSQTVNPYQIDGSKFSQTVQIALFDTLKDLSWAFPLRGDTSKINSKFGMRHWRWHYGIDLDLETGDPVYAAFDGIVRISRYGRGFGNFVVLRHYNGLETVYGHLSKRDVSVGFYVKAGQRIGLGGSTGRSSGAHLHFELRYQGNPINPEYVYNFEINTLKSRNFELNSKHFKYLKQIKQSIYHRIGSGDSLWLISRKYRVSIGQICRLNGISPRTTLRIGKRLRIR